LKYLKHTLATYVFSKTWSADGQTEHCTAGSGCAVTMEKEDGSGRAVAWPPVSGCAAPSERHLQWRRQRRSGRYGLARRGGSSCAAVRKHATALRAWGSTPQRCGCGNAVAVQHARAVRVQRRGHVARRNGVAAAAQLRWMGSRMETGEQRILVFLATQID
jgi:hypothetical protein